MVKIYYEMTPYEYRQIMEGFSYKEHLDCPSDFWHGKPEEGLFGGCEFVWRYYEPNVGVMHKTDEFYLLTEIDKGKYMYDLRTENKYDECFIYRRYQNGILRIKKRSL